MVLGPSLCVNCETGEVERVELSPEKIAYREALAAEAAEETARLALLEAIREAAKTTLFGTPDWVGWTSDEIYGYVMNEVTDLATARLVMALALKHLVEVRDYIMPELRAHHKV